MLPVILLFLFIGFMLQLIPAEWAVILTFVILIYLLIIEKKKTHNAATKSQLTRLQNQLLSLILLRLELNQQHQNGQIAAAVYHQAISEIDQLWARLIEQQTFFSTTTQRSLLESAWLQLNQQLSGRLGIPPWRVPKTPQPREFTTEQKKPPAKTEWIKPKISPPQPAPTPPPIAKTPTAETTTSSPTKKSVFKKLLPSRALLFEWLVAFLWQNFGWFIGGFCFIAGSIFLVTYTSGFAKTFAVVLLLTLYVLMLLGSGYYVRRYRPQLKTISDVLLILGILLIPLDFAATVRLIDSGFATTPGLLGIALLVTLMIAIGFTWAAQLASALIDRSLQGEHPWLFISLASLQYAIPLLKVLPSWPLIAGLHLTALLILSYAFWRLTHQWLQALFVERNKSAYYAIGTLVYSTSISFIHLSWAVAIEWPAGYAGPFVMMLTLLLLYVDGQLKHWRRHYVWLSYFTFVLYALSVIALLLAWHGQPSLLPPWFSAATLTLILGVIFYALMIKHYLSLPPLYGLLLCVSGLYGLALLQYVPYPSYFLFSLPGFAALALGYRWAYKHHATSVASMLHRTLLLGALSVFIFSLAHAEPGIIALITNLVALLIIHFYKSTHYNICFSKLLKKSVVSKWLQDYTEAVFIILTLAYCPVFLGHEQFSFALAALALFWGYWGVKRSQNSIIIFLNSSLWALMLSLMFMGYSSPQLLPGLLLFHASLFLGLSLHLRLQSFFYLLLLSLAAAGLLLKIYYFPGASGGKTVIFLALATWLILWWLYYRVTSKPHISLPQHANQLTLLGFWKVSPGEHSLETVIKSPLENSFYLLWLLGLATLLQNTVLILSYQSLTFNVHWALAASGNALITVLVAGYSRQSALLFLAVLLWIAALAVWQPIELNLLISVSALATWLLSLVILRYRRLWVSLLGWQGGYSHSGGRKQAEFSIHLAALSLIVLNLIITITSSATQWPILLTSILFFAWSGYRYRNPSYSYGVIICFSLIILSSYRFNLETLSASLLPALLTLGLATLAQGLSHWQTPLATLYQRPLWHTALFCFALASIGAALNYDSGLAWSAFILMLAQFPLLRPWAQAALFRGITVALLLTVTVISGCMTTETLSCLPGWSFILWIMAYYGLPQWNQRWPQWALQPEFWPGLGLALITVYFANSVFLEGIYQWQTFGLMTLYLFLLGLRQNWAGILAWLVTLGLTLTGVIAAVNAFPNSLNLPFFIITTLFWFNVLIYLSSLLNQGFWKPLKQPLLFWSWLGLHLYLGLMTLLTIMGLLQLDIIKVIPGGIVLSLALLLSVTYLLHFKSLSPTLGTHGLILVVFNVFFWLFKDVLTLPLLITLWSGGLLGYQVIQVAQQRFERQDILSLWLMLSFALALAEWLFTPTLAYERLLISIFLTVISLSFAWISHYGKLGWAVGMMLLATSLHLFWRLLLPQVDLRILLSTYGFQAGVLAWLILYLKNILFSVEYKSSATQLSVWNQQRHQNILWLFNGLLPILTCFTVIIGLFYHGVMLITWVDHAYPIAITPVVHLSVLATGIIWIRLWWHYAPDAEIFIYGLGVIVALLLLYLRTLLLGSLAPTLGDTTLLMASAYMMLALQHVIPSQALYRFSLLLPILALCTLPLQWGSVSATLTLWAAALLYFVISRLTTQKVPLYLSVLAANLGIYLWLPQWAHSYNLVHLYTVPAALTVLLMAHLHQRELKPKILYHVRLIALSTLYTSATLDVFLQQGQLSVFALVLVLSLGGIVIGIGLRNRAFLYSGSLFLVLNVLGQLLRFYPEDRLGKAILLMILGGIIIGGMIGFSLQRQALIRRWQLLRTDLATWH